MLKSLTADGWDALLQMQRTDPFCKAHLQKTIKWQSPTSRGQHFHSCKGTPLQAHVRCWKAISHPSHSQVMEIHHSSRSP